MRALGRRFDSQEFEPWTLLSGELTADRFAACDEYLASADTLQSVFKTPLRSSDSAIQFGVFRQALRKVRFDDSESDRYKSWLALTKEEAMRLGHDSRPVMGKQLIDLKETGDPAAHIIDKLDRLMIEEFSGYQNDINFTTKFQVACDLFIASLHGEQLSDSD